MRNWKLIGVCCLAIVISFSSPAIKVWAGSPDFARTAEEWERLRDNAIEYDELAGLIREYNVTVQKNQLDISHKKKDDLITNDQYAQYYRDAASDARSSISGDDPVSDASYAVSAAKADKEADDNTEDLETYRLTYDQTEADLVATAQTSMISYFHQKNEMERSKVNLELLEAEYQAVLAKQSAGMATQMDVLLVQENIYNAKGSIDKLYASTEETRQKLCIMLGWKYDDNPEIMEIPAVDMDRIPFIDLEADKQIAFQNNYSLKINKRKLANASADITKETLKRTISSNEQNINAAIVSNYQTILQSKAAYDQAVGEYNLESTNMNTAQQRYQVGMLSALDYQKQNNAYVTKSIAVRSAELTLFQTIQAYDNGIAGLASSGG